MCQYTLQWGRVSYQIWQAHSAAGVSFLQSFVSICWLALSSEAKSIHMLKFVCALDFLFFLMIHGKSRHTWLTWTFWLIHNVARIPETNTFISFCRDSKMQDTKGWSGIAWGSCWWRRRRGWRRGHTPSGRATAPWSPKQTSLRDRVRLSRSMVRVGSGYATFAFATWTVSFQSDYSFHNWWGCHLLHTKCF